MHASCSHIIVRTSLLKALAETGPELLLCNNFLVEDCVIVHAQQRPEKLNNFADFQDRHRK